MCLGPKTLHYAKFWAQNATKTSAGNIPESLSNLFLRENCRLSQRLLNNANCYVFSWLLVFFPALTEFTSLICVPEGRAAPRGVAILLHLRSSPDPLIFRKGRTWARAVKGGSSKSLFLYSDSVLTLYGLILAPILNLFKLPFLVLGS